MRNVDLEMYEVNLPTYLQEDLDNFKNADPDTCLRMDIYYDLLYSSINSAEVDDEITSEQAWYLREKYLGLERK